MFDCSVGFPLRLCLLICALWFFVRRLVLVPVLVQVCFLQFYPAQLLRQHRALDTHVRSYWNPPGPRGEKMAEVLACQIVILDGTTISQDVNVSICSLVTKAHHFRLPITVNTRSFCLQKRAVGQVLLSLVYKHLGLDEKDYFGLLYTDDKNNPVCDCICVAYYCRTSTPQYKNALVTKQQ